MIRLFRPQFGHSKLLHKQNLIPIRSIHFISAAASIPHPAKKDKGGEDAYFISDYTVGVADGVGGWAKEGIDAGKYAKSLMHYASIFAEPCDDYDEAKASDLRSVDEILKGAYAQVKVPGSSTACIVQIQGNTLHTLNLGDSGFLICRKENDLNELEENTWKIVEESESQCHFFNCPYQLGMGSKDRPSDAILSRMKVREGDIVILATDGVFDNLHSSEITDILATTSSVIEHTTENNGLVDSIQILANSIASNALQVSRRRAGITPISIAAKKAGYKYSGGKIDDITVTVSIVTAKEFIPNKYQ